MKKLFAILLIACMAGSLAAQNQIVTTSNVQPDGFVYHNPGSSGERCIAVCPPEGYDEGEPCGADLNGGCNMLPTPVFQPVICGDVVCGHSFYDLSQGIRDTDWFEIYLSESRSVTLTLYSEAASTLFGLIEQIVPGVPGCDNITGFVGPYQYAVGCANATLVFDIGPGTYYFFVAPDFSGPEYTCANGGFNYTLSIECQNPWSEVPVSSWALFVGIGLILMFAIIRFRKLV